MEAQVVTIDQPFHSAYEKFIAITDHLSTEMAGDKTHSEIEAYLETDGRELLRLLLQDHLDNQGSGRVGNAVCGSDGVVRSHKRDHMETGYKSVFGAVRVARLAESLALIKALLSGQTVTATGPHYAAANAQISPRPVQQPRPPILVAAGKRRLAELAAREADIVALGIPPTETEAEITERIGWIREAAGSRFDQIELNLNLMAVGEQVPRWIASQMKLTAEGLARAGAVSAVTGTTDEMVDTLQRRRERLGVSYIAVGDELMDGLAPVVERLAGR